jgi:hypothetical protein
MWVLFGTNHNTVQNESRVFFIGVFDSVELANRDKDYLIALTRTKHHSDFFVKEVTMNQMYTHDWSNNFDV